MTMLRRCMKTAVALAALATVALAPMSSAKGGPEKSLFAGTYGWTSGDSWAVAISDGGRITGSLVSSSTYTKGSLSGRVDADGTYSFTISVTAPTFDDPERPSPGGPKQHTGHYKFAGDMELNSDGNVVGTAVTHESFVWFRS